MNTQTTSSPEPMYDNTNNGAVFPYSDGEMRGPWQFEAPNPDLMMSLTPSLGIMIRTKDGEVVAVGQAYKVTSQNPDAPILRAKLQRKDTNETIRLVAWKRDDMTTGREFLQFRPDRPMPDRPFTGRCFV